MSFLWTKASRRLIPAHYSNQSAAALRHTSILTSMIFEGSQRDYPYRSASTKVTTNPKKGGGSNKDEDMALPSYFERKQARKQERIQHYQAKLQRAVALKERRPRNVSDEVHVKRMAFQNWWHPRLIREERWDRQARQQGKEWKYEVAALVERLPQILPDQEEFEREFDELQAYLGQFGKEYPPEFTAPNLPKPGFAPVTNEELLALLPEGFTPAPRETEADKTGQTDTLDRKLKTSVYLLVNGKLPTTTLELKANDKDDDQNHAKQQESLLVAAQRAVREQTGKDSTLELYCPSQAPVAVYMTKDDNDSPYFGTKTFFMRLQYDDGTVVGGKTRKVAWLDRSEIVSLYSNNNTNKEKDENPDDEAKFYHYLL